MSKQRAMKENNILALSAHTENNFLENIVNRLPTVIFRFADFIVYPALYHDKPIKAYVFSPNHVENASQLCIKVLGGFP